MLHFLGWKPSNPQVWDDATLDVFENRGILPVSDWTGECCFVGIRELFVSQLLVQGSSWGQQIENNSEEERDAVWKKFLTQCGANLTSPGLSVHSGALVRVLVFVHHVFILISGRRIIRKGKALDYFSRWSFRGSFLKFISYCLCRLVHDHGLCRICVAFRGAEAMTCTGP